jgi:hypothetical protein
MVRKGMIVIDDKGRDDGYRRNEAMNLVDLESPHISNDRQTPLFLSCTIETRSDMHRIRLSKVLLSRT